MYQVQHFKVRSQIMYFNNFLAPPKPSNLTVANEDQGSANINVTFEWYSSGEFVWYTITVIPPPPSHPGVDRVDTPSWNVTLDLGQKYSVTIIAENCVGESSPSTIDYSECHILHD